MKQLIHFNARILHRLLQLKCILSFDSSKKIYLCMKLTGIILLVINLQVSAVTLAQNVSISEKNVSLKSVFKELRRQTDYYFIYNNELLSEIKPVSINVKNVSIQQALDKLFSNTSLSYSIEDKIIVVKPKAAESSAALVKGVDRRITGTVTDAADGLPLPGVSIRIKGRSLGTVTRVDGTFTLTIESTDQTLVFNYLGYATKEVAVSAATNYIVTLNAQSKQLEEVNIAFGTTTKRELTNSVAVVNAKDIEQRSISNLNTALVGAAPGVQTNAGSGQPGEGPAIRVRGFGSITNDNNPLYVLDGAPYEGVINNINPDDIESISVLKDAASTALYGARAANGIVLITTKRGKRNKNNINFKATQAVSERGLPNYETVNAYEYFPLVWQSLKNGSSGSAEQASLDVKAYLGWNPFNVPDDEIVLPSGVINPAARLLYPEDLKFSDELKRTGLRSDLGLTMSGGSDKNDYFVSLGYLRENGYVKASDFKRYSGRLRVNSQPRKWLNAGLSVTGNFSSSEQANESSGINENPFYVDLLLAPIYPVHIHNPVTGEYILDTKGDLQYDAGDYRPLMTGRNIASETYLNINAIRRNAVIANANIDATFLKNFKFSTTFSGNLGNYRSSVFDNPTIGDAKGVGRITRTNSMTAYLNFNELLTYRKTFGDHKIGVLLGHENYINYYDYLTGSRRGMAVDVEGSQVLDNFTTVTGLGSYDRYYKTEGFLSKLDYSYNSKYIVSFSARRDASSRFEAGKKWGNFWAVSGAWNIDREKFFKVNWVDNLKLRASHGEVGNDAVGTYFAYQALYTLGYNNGSEPGAIKTTNYSDVLWETNKNSDVAVEFSMFKSRINGTVEVYRRQSKNLLFDVTLPLTSPATTTNANFGSMRNEGLEVQLAGDLIRKKGFSWNMNINASTLRNKVLELPPQYLNKINGTKKYIEGKSMYEFWLRDWVGVDPVSGLDMYVSANKATSPIYFNGDTLTSVGSNAQYHYTGSAIPDLYGSVNNTFSYKNFSLQVMFIYQIGGKTFDNDYQSLMYRGSAGRALHKDQLNAWQQEGDITNVTKRGTGATMYDSDKWLTDASYLNFRTATFTYNVPAKFSKRYGMQSARIYASGENLFITSARKGMDPTQTYTGAPSYTYAPARIISLGLNVSL